MLAPIPKMQHKILRQILLLCVAYFIYSSVRSMCTKFELGTDKH